MKGAALDNAYNLLKLSGICEQAKACGANTFVETLLVYLGEAQHGGQIADTSYRSQAVADDRLSRQCMVIPHPTHVYFPSYSTKVAEIHPLLLLLRTFGPQAIDAQILDLALCDQRRWNEKGAVSYLSIRDAGLHQCLTSCFQSRDHLDAVLELLMKDGSLKKDASTNTPQYTVQAEMTIPQEFLTQGALFVAHVFPRDEALNPQSVYTVLCSHGF